MSVAIQRLTGSDSQAYRTLRLEALANAPKAFGESHEEAAARGDEYWQKLLIGDRAFFGGFVDGKLAGSANFSRERGTKVEHKGWLLGMYVSPRARGTGCALLLVEAVARHAASVGARQLHLGVGVQNAPARRLYEKAGFEQYGTEPRGLQVNGEFVDEHLLVRFLDKEEVK